jgi:coproporphyrinogen III oxidase-like Fe-S oxidoreductase
MHVIQTSDEAFQLISGTESEFLSPLVNCSLDALFKSNPESAPIALNLHFHEGLKSDYLQLLITELNLYAQKFGQRKAAKTWLRGTPLSCLSAAEITELSFLTASNFDMDEGTYSEYGFECSVADINESNLALMKGLRFTTLLLNIDATHTPKTQQIWPLLDLIKQYKFQELQFRLDANNSDSTTLHHWLESMMVSQPQLVELHGMEEMSEPIMLDQLTKLMSARGYTLIGDRYFVSEHHPLLQLKQSETLQYTPWGLSHPKIKDWIGLGIGALGKIGGGYYQNTDKESVYQSNLSQAKLPIQSSGKYPNENTAQVSALIEQLICLHQISNPKNHPLIGENPRIYQVFQQACNKGWMIEEGGNLSISSQGLNHLHEITQNLLSS